MPSTPAVDRRPNFFIAGAPKCGTTSLHSYLSTHPRIFLPKDKEPSYWSFDFPRFRTVNDEAEYLHLFDDAGPSHEIRGEASTIYFYSREAPQRIRAFSPDAKILVMLRNPVELVRSWHSHLCFTFDEDVTDFEQAWNLSSQRRAGKQIPKRCRFPGLLDYSRIGRLATELRRWFDVFPRERVKCLLLDDMIRSPSAVYEEVLAFVGVPSDGRAEFPRLNENKRHRRRWLALLVERKPPWLARAVARVEQSLGIEKFGLYRFAADAAPREAMPVRLQEMLRAEFSEEVRELGSLVNRDLSRWLEPSVTART